MNDPNAIHLSCEEEAFDFYKENAERTAIIYENPRSDGEASWVSGPANPLQIALALAVSTYDRGIWRIAIWRDGDQKDESLITDANSIGYLVSAHRAAGR